MYLKKLMDKYKNNKIELYVDMDGVIADYVVGIPYNFDQKRPLYDSIKKLEEISKMSNVSMNILSITKMNIGKQEKNVWLDKYAPFFKKENRNIISKEENPNISSENLKLNFLKNLNNNDKIIILIDDDPIILKTIKKELKNIVLLKDTVLVD